MSKVSRSDVHGALVTIIKSACPSMEGLSGIVLYESTNMIHIITPTNKPRSIPKKGTVFTLPWKSYTFVIFGTHFRYSPAERSVKKYKLKHNIDLPIN